MNITEYIGCTDPKEREEFENAVYNNVWHNFVKHLPTREDFEKDYYGGWNSINVWYDGSEILCNSEELADMIADILDDISGEKLSHTGYYDPEEDARDNCVDIHTGWFYVDWD